MWGIAVQFSKAMEGLPERWWFGHTHNDARTQRFDKHESKKAMKVGPAKVPLVSLHALRFCTACKACKSLVTDARLTRAHVCRSVSGSSGGGSRTGLRRWSWPLGTAASSTS